MGREDDHDNENDNSGTYGLAVTLFTTARIFEILSIVYLSDDYMHPEQEGRQTELNDSCQEHHN